MNLLFRLILIPVLAFALTFAVDVAARCTGEVSFLSGIELCACTVRHRMDAGWTQGAVLDSYYAKSVKPRGEAVEAVRGILSGETKCEPVYYLWSRSDLAGIGLDVDDAVVTVCDETGRRCVYGFGREALR